MTSLGQARELVKHLRQPQRAHIESGLLGVSLFQERNGNGIHITNGR